MSSVTTGQVVRLAAPAADLATDAVPVDYSAYARPDGADGHVLHLMAEGVHCGACVQRIETTLKRQPDVRQARLNLTTRRLVLGWEGPVARANPLVAAASELGYRFMPYDPAELGDADAKAERELLRAMAVAGFAAGNIMLFSVSIWAGHVEAMGDATRTLFHWFSALIALPTIAYAIRPFARSAWEALSHRRTNMDVPITVGVLLTAGISLFSTITHGQHAYFDSAVSLLFFLLLGRYLDRRARGQARSAAQRLLALGAQAVTVITASGDRRLLPVREVVPGMMLLVAAGERIAVDGRVREGQSELDMSLVTGETLPAKAGPGEKVFAGTVNLAAPLRVEVAEVGEDTLLAGIVRLLEAAEQRRARYVSLAERIARAYTPVVHLAALLTFLGWVFLMHLGWQPALLIAASVLIITCPCALGLAVPAVQVVASGRLMRRGILLKSATALERLAEVDTVVFDKTGTLTLGRPELVDAAAIDPASLRLATSLAANSRHPLARALCRAAPDVVAASGVEERPGLGLRLAGKSGEIRLGSRRWCDVADSTSGEGPEIWLKEPGRPPLRFAFTDRLRPDAVETLAALRGRGLAIELLSGDREVTVRQVAETLGIARWRAAMSPAEKTQRLEELAREGRRVLMVGDGLNDAPALAAALVSLSPSTAADITQTSADAVFQGARLGAVTELLQVARRCRALVRQNFLLALGYNLLAVPLAIAGFVTPLVAAIAMSSSSLIVTGNALRLGIGTRRPARR
ncbi:MAG TPA: heavy metal translocating P-type ATPase [Hypericibacter adhaerens]|uniref:Copper-translocating P-type ATPase n=1 Tax=Hypericibacter adhaerens TaxID=2602016 RepID=A0A5J6MVK9_9PROT|nr:heavy metal translocating P-type ATPase [Hypericibacter adhaerens]QEX20765.1 copper-translocating P-type ATPase [Hypericibacter adhaerens]HWA42195.1 heavy metal translocating P-type ATPase [Hypericibacter adhaerens]